MGWQKEPSALPTPSLFQHKSRAWFGGGDNAVEVDWRNTRPPPNGFKRSSTGETTRSIPSGFKRSSTLETVGTMSARTSLSSSSSSSAASRIATPNKSVHLKKKSVSSAPPSSSLFKHTPSTWLGGKDKVVDDDWRNARIPLNSVKPSRSVSRGRTRMETPAVESGGRFRPISQRPAKGNANVRRDRPAVGRSLSRGRTRTETPDAADKKQSVQSRSRSKNRQGRRDCPSSDISGNDSTVSLEYDSDSAKTARVNKNWKLSRTEKTTHSMRGHISNSHHNTSETSCLSRSRTREARGSSREARARSRSSHRDKDKGHISSSQHNTSETSCLSRSRTREARDSSREARARSRSSHRDKDKSHSVKIRSLFRGSCSKSSQLIVRQETNLRVSDMPFNDQNNRDGYYTGDINDYGQPMGHGTLRYDDGAVFKGWWKDGYSEEMDASAALKACADKKIHRFY